MSSIIVAVAGGFVLGIGVAGVIQLLVKPNRDVSEEWSKALVALMEDHDFVPIGGGHTAKLGDVEIWVANHPYASFSPYKLAVYPTPEVRDRARDKYIRDISKHIESMTTGGES